ncbi:MAG: hypothetical protein ACRDQY_02860 [Pseudonocardiaceae bacterium]
MLCTCAVRRIPAAWHDQLTPEASCWSI